MLQWEHWCCKNEPPTVPAEGYWEDNGFLGCFTDGVISKGGEAKRLRPTIGILPIFLIECNVSRAERGLYNLKILF